MWIIIFATIIQENKTPIKEIERPLRTEPTTFFAYDMRAMSHPECEWRPCLCQAVWFFVTLVGTIGQLYLQRLCLIHKPVNM